MAAVSQHAMRRHPGGPLDPSPSFGSYYALAHQQVLPPDKSSKKTWSQRLKISKTDKLLSYTEPLDFANGSALSRSMKYAEPWLYGTIRGIPAPPINRQQMFTQFPEVAVMICSCPEYLNGTKKDMKKATICKKCRGSRLPLAAVGGTMRLHSTPSMVYTSRESAGTVRIPSFSSKQRPSILNRENDPYDMMRRSRLISPEMQPINKLPSKSRAKSSSPTRSRGRSRKRSPSPSSIIQNGHRSRSASRSNNNQNGWINETEMELAARRSILQSDLSAYELISKTSHISEFSPINHDDDDDVFNMHSKKYENILNSDFNITAVAGQRVKLTSNRNSSIQQDLEQYEDINFMIDDHHHSSSNKNKNRNDYVSPTRPPRKKPDNPNAAENESPAAIAAAETSPKSEFILTTASLSHISNDMTTTNLQINVIKSILKRPATESENIDHHHTTRSAASANIKSKSISMPSTLYNNTKKYPSKVTISDGRIADGKINMMLLAKNGKGTIDAGNHHQSIKDNRVKSNSGSHFYLPMPQRKKVQFLVGNEIIQSNNYNGGISDRDYNDDDDNDHNEYVSNNRQIIENYDQDFGPNDTKMKSNHYVISSTTTSQILNGEMTIDQCKEQEISVCNGICVEQMNSCSVVSITGSAANVLEDNEIPLRKNVVLRRTHSERRLSEPSVAETENITFIDTTALRSKPSRCDSRSIFSETTGKTRPKDPPPPPPSSSSPPYESSLDRFARKRTPTRPPRQSSRKSHTKDITDEKSLMVNGHCDSDPSDGVKVIINNLNNLIESRKAEVLANTALVIRDDEDCEQRKRIQANIEAFQGSRLFGQTSPSKKTVVKVAPLVINKESPAIHRLEIRSDYDEIIENSKKTSIMINGDDCYSTINVNDNTPLYQSSVVVNGDDIKPAILKSSSNTVSISVTTPPTHKENISFYSDLGSRSIIPIEGFSSPAESIVLSPSLGKTTITLDFNGDMQSHSESENTISETSANDSTEKELLLLLRNPVEAVKRNLVPHVCGKTNHEDQIKFANKLESIPEKPIENKKFHHSENSSFIGKLLEDPTLGHLAEGLDNELVAKLIENSLVRLKESRQNLDLSGTKDEKDMNKLIETSLQKVKEERLKLETTKLEQEKLEEHEKHSLSSGNSYSSANYEPYDFDNNDLSDCYQSCSSELTVDEEGNVTRSKFYQMLVDATLSEIEISTNVDDDHHYESIRMNGDPIYEEISDVPPPLPLCPPPTDVEMEKKNSKSMFEGASKYDILSYLVDAKERGLVPEDSYTYNFSNTSDIIIEEEADKVTERILHNRQNSDLSSRTSQLSNVSDTSDESSLKHNAQRKSSAEIERNDSGVGSETSKTSRSKYQSLPGSLINKNSPIHLCEDCDGQVETQVTDSGVMYAPLACRKCCKKRAERKEIVTEIIETEEKYSRDLQIILEEFYQPMLVAGLLTQDQLSAIFLNCEELLENSQALADKMRDAYDIAIEQGDDDLLTVNIGKLLLDAAPMLHAFESYCIRQAAASLLLANMEKEKELLRIFLRVSQMENAVLRRMNLNSFLMVPVQRVTKYPLLLARLYKVTPTHVEGRELLKQAQEKIELHLNHMNREAKDVPTKLWRRISSSSPGRRSSCEMDMINIKLRKMAIDLLEWHHDEVRFPVEGKLLFTQPTDNNWRKGRTIKLTPVNALLVTNGKPTATYKLDKILGEQINFPRHTGIREAALLMVREKSSRYTLLREPLFLDRCIVCTESDWEDYFEVQEISSKDTFIFKAEDGARTKLWYTQLQYHAQGMGAWRKRRNALANIMINGMMMRS